jgi:hypothetical protein
MKCANEGCPNVVAPSRGPTPRKWCSEACRKAARRRSDLETDAAIVVDVVAGGHVVAWRRSVEALEPGAGSEALRFYGESMARHLDEAPSAWAAREYRQAVAMLLGLETDGETLAEREAHAEFLRMVSTAQFD